MLNLIVVLVVLLVAAGIIMFTNKKSSQSTIVTDKNAYAKLAVILVGIYTLALLGCHFVWNYQYTQAKKSFTTKIQQMKEQQIQEIATIKRNYAKEIGLMEWKNKVFANSSQMEQDLTTKTKEYQLSPQEVHMWRGLAENNTIDKLMPKRDTNEVLREYQTRLKKNLNEIRSGHTLMNSDIRMLADNINTIRVIGKEYEKTLDVFRELYDNIIASSKNGTVMEKPKQKKVLFFPVKQKEYDQLVQQYYEAQGNQKAQAEIAEKLKQAINQAEQEFQAINRKFNDNVGFLENNATGIAYNSTKLEKLIENAIREADVVVKSTNQNLPAIKVTNPTPKH